MKRLFYIIVLLYCAAINTSCTKDDNTSYTKDNIYPNISLPISGSYTRNFKVEESDQKLTYNFTNEIIKIKMEGEVYSNEYEMIPLEYDKKQMKIVAVGRGGISILKDGKYFVIFLKDIENNQITIFKKEFETKEKAIEFKKPSADVTDSYGWNNFKKL